MNLPAKLHQTLPERRRIRVRGLVQGVGFRPHVFRCASALGISGFVSNGPEGVLIEAEGSQLDVFLARLQSELPPLARIDSLIETPMKANGSSGFQIAPTQAGAAAGAAIPADTAICRDCLGELFDPDNRRYLHPFIACCNCGPRYTMTRRLPYDRAHTAMDDFGLCPACEAEYIDPFDRRFHAEPVACHECGPRLSADINDIASALTAGKIIAIKGLGGYHLACDAGNHDTVKRLRACKQRDGKPFAVMVLNSASARYHIAVDDNAQEQLESPERPIVIAPSSQGADGLCPALSTGLGTLGVMLPYTAIHYLVFHTLLGKPPGTGWLETGNPLALVMTSANISGDPLITGAEDAEQRLSGIADAFLHHDREIPARADDSVLRCSAAGTTIVRRARGFTPHAVKLAGDGPRVLALGPHLKSTVTMTRGDRAYVSPHVGDLATPAAVAFHAETAQAMRAMLHCDPEIVACDLARDFASTRLAEQLATDLDLPLVRVQHHHAHVAAVLAEHRRVEEPVLGLALDGHGLGADGQSWGGELLRVDGEHFQRLGHLAPLPLPGGDRAAREPWRMAAGALHRMGRGMEIPGRFADEPLSDTLSQWLCGADIPVTTAAGRLFDTAAGLLGISHSAGFEGEPPMRLEGLARRTRTLPRGYHLTAGELDFLPLLENLADCGNPEYGAELFHGTLLDGLTAWVTSAAGRENIGTVVLCGGCFLNAHLAGLLPQRLAAAGLRVLQARAMPPNDGAISLGQAWVAQRTD